MHFASLMQCVCNARRRDLRDGTVCQLDDRKELARRRGRTYETRTSDGEALGGTLVRLELLDDGGRGEPARANGAQHIEAEHCAGWTG